MVNLNRLQEEIEFFKKQRLSYEKMMPSEKREELLTTIDELIAERKEGEE